MTKRFLLAVFLLASSVAFGARIIPLPDLNRPDMIETDGKRLYIGEKFVISIYSLSDYSLIKRFGSEGEGPGEFRVAASLRVLPDGLAVVSQFKIAWYSFDGKYIGEKRTPLHFFPGGKVLTTDRYVSLLNYVEPQKSLWIMDAEFKPITEVYKEKTVHAANEVFGTLWIFTVSRGRIFSVGETGFQVGVYDSNGKEIARIVREYSPIRFTDEHKEEIFSSMKAQGAPNHILAQQRKNLVFPEYISAIQYLSVCGDDLFIGTSVWEHDQKEFFVYDINGKYKKRLLLPVKSIEKSRLLSYPHCLDGVNLYQVIENDVSGDWELHITPLRPAR